MCCLYCRQHSFMPTSRDANDLSPGLLGDKVTCHWRSRESASQRSESSPAERRSERTATRGSGCGPDAGSQPGDEVSDTLAMASLSEVGQFRASESWPGSRLLLRSWPGEASRPSEVIGSARAVPDCLASLRPAERTKRELAPSLAEAKWSAAAAKLASQSSGGGGTVRRLGAK